MTIDSDHVEVKITAKNSKSGRSSKPSLCANIPILDILSQEYETQDFCMETKNLRG
jgi:hypothetical protein